MQTSTALSAPELLILLYLPDHDARKAVKVGFIGLLVRGALRLDIEERPGVLRPRRIVHLRPGAARPAVTSPEAALLGIVQAAQRAGGTMASIVAEARRSLGSDLSRFATQHVLPSLERRGLAEARRVRRFAIFPVTRFFPTAAGEAERERARRVMEQARQIPRLLDRDPKQAAALAIAAGASLLLIEELWPYLNELSTALRGLGPESGDFGGGDFSGADFDFSSFDSVSLDSFDAGFAAFDASFDSASGGDGGGDSGGGDGGSSGC